MSEKLSGEEVSKRALEILKKFDISSIPVQTVKYTTTIEAEDLTRSLVIFDKKYLSATKTKLSKEYRKAIRAERKKHMNKAR